MLPITFKFRYPPLGGIDICGVSDARESGRRVPSSLRWHTLPWGRGFGRALHPSLDLLVGVSQRLCAVALDQVDIHLSGKVLRVEAVDHLDGRSGVTRQR